MWTSENPRILCPKRPLSNKGWEWRRRYRQMAGLTHNCASQNTECCLRRWFFHQVGSNQILRVPDGLRTRSETLMAFTLTRCFARSSATGKIAISPDVWLRSKTQMAKRTVNSPESEEEESFPAACLLPVRLFQFANPCNRFRTLERREPQVAPEAFPDGVPNPRERPIQPVACGRTTQTSPQRSDQG